MTLLLSLCLLFAPHAPEPAQDHRTAARAAARAGLPTFLARLPPGQEPDYGFDQAPAAAAAMIGTPYQVLTVTPGSVAGGVLSLEEIGLWRFPVLVGGRARALLSVGWQGGGWTAVSLGGAGLARHIEAVAEVTDVQATGTLVRIFQLRSDFLLVNGGFLVLPSAERALGLKSGRIYTWKRLLPVLKKAMSEVLP